MADFCRECSVEHLGIPDHEYLGDLAGISTEANTAKGEYASVLCEGCGCILVDHTGKRVSEPPAPKRR